MLNYLNFIWAIILLTSCNQTENDFDILISNYLESNCKVNMECVIDLAEVTKFNWDKVYVFSSAVSLEEIENTLNLSLSSYSDIADRIVFVNGEEVVYHKEWFNNPSSPPEGVAFDLSGSIREYTNSNALFTILRVRDLLVLKEK